MVVCFHLKNDMVYVVFIAAGQRRQRERDREKKGNARFALLCCQHIYYKWLMSWND